MPPKLELRNNSRGVLQRAYKRHAQPVQVKSIQQLTEADLQQHEQILFVISTYGTGEAPDLASNFAKKLLKTNLELQHVKYAVLALGSKEYPDTYCSFGHTVDEGLKTMVPKPSSIL